MDQSKRTRLRALCEAATPGPWDAIYDEDAGEWMVRTGHADVAVLTWQQALDALGLSPVTMRTAAFIAASRAALPALLDALDAAECERDALRAEIARLRAPRPSAIVLRPVDPMPLRGLPCACDEWGPGHLDGCPNGDAEPVDAPVPWDDEDMALADGDRRALDVVTRERDEARAEAERLRRELAETRGDFAQMREDRDALKGALSRANELRVGDRAEARLDEREACAAIADEHAAQEDVYGADACARLAEAIRARGAGGGA